MRDARLMALDLGFPRLQARSNTLTLSRESRLDSFISTIEDKKTWSNEGLGQSLIGTRRQGPRFTRKTTTQPDSCNLESDERQKP